VANQRHVDILLRLGVETWNTWRKEEPGIRPDLTEANLSGANLSGANLFGADLHDADLSGADLSGANLSGADLSGANLFKANLHQANLTMAHLFKVNLFKAVLFKAILSGANLIQANLIQANLTNAYLIHADLPGADLAEANLTNADLRLAHLTGANLTSANFTSANLTSANLTGAYFHKADLSGADLSGADLTGASCLGTCLSGATLTGCTVYGISAWDLDLGGAVQTDLRITPEGQPAITVDNLEVAQFLYLLLHNQKVRALLDTITSKVVLILGRFSKERKPVLDALREALRRPPHGYVPVLFDFSGPESRDTTETVILLARMARFVIADLTDPGSVPYELAKIVPDAHVPVQPLLLEGATTFAMAGDLWMAREMLKVVRYTTAEELLTTLSERVIAPAEAKVTEIQRERATALLRSGL